VVHDGTRWIAVGQEGTTFTSANGTSWARRTPTGELVSFSAIAHNGLTGGSSLYMAMGSDDRVWTSSTGSNWNKVTLLSFPGGGDVVWDGTQFVVVSDFFISVTTNGNSWGSTGMFGNNSSDSDVMIRCGFADGKFVAIGYNYNTGAPVIYSGTAYNNFVKRRVPAGSGALKGVTRAGSQWIVVGDSGTILTSPDGTTWTKRAVSDPSYGFTHVASTGTLHFASSDLNYGYYTSTNGTTWTYRDASMSPFSSVGAADGRIFGFHASQSSVMITTDGINWSYANLPLLSSFNTVRYNGTELMAVGANLAFISSDLVPEVSFVSDSLQVLEGSPTASVAVKLTVPATAAFDVPVSVLVSSTAVLNTDYQTVPTTLSFAIGQQLAILEVPLLNDVTLDGEKKLQLSVGAPTGTRLGSPNNTTITIVDDDAPPTLRLISPKRTLAEHGGTVLVQAELSWPAPGPVSATLARTGTAAEGVDYTAPASVSFVTGERLKTFSVVVNDDSTTEQDEDATLTLTAISGAVAAATEQTFELGIYDNDAAATPGRRWTLRQPGPTSDGLFGLTAFGSKLVAVGRSGTTLVSTDAGVTWTRRETGISSSIALSDVVASGSKVYAVGNDGYVLSSDDAVSWAARLVPGASTTHYFGGIATNGTRMVIAGVTYDWSLDTEVPIIYSSPDGENWTQESLPITSGSLYDVAWNGSLFVALGSRPVGSTPTTYILTSPDGRVWTSRSSALQGVSLYNVVAAGTSFVAFDHTEDCYVSTDGVTWNKRTAGTLGPIMAGAWDGSKFIGVGGAITNSASLTTFSQVASPTTAELNEVVFANGQFTAVEENSTIYTSPTGVTWTKRSTGFDNFADLRSVTWAGNQFVAVGTTAFASVPTLIATSPDGSSWTPVTNTLKKELNGVAFSGSTLVAVGRNGAIATSVNGTAWSLKASGTTLDLNGVIWSRNQFVAVGGHVTDELGSTGPGGSVVLTSPNGTTWTRRTVPTNRPLLGITFNGSQFVAVGRALGDGPQPGTAAVITSPDGINWTARDSQAFTDLTSVANDGAQLIATGLDYQLYASADHGQTWTQVPNTPAAEAAGHGLYSIVRSSAGYTAAGDWGRTLFSPNGVDWSSSRSESTQPIHGLAWNSQTLVAVGQSATAQTSGVGCALALPSVAFGSGAVSVAENAGTVNVVVTLSSPPTAKVNLIVGASGLSSTVTLTGVEADVVVPALPLVFNPGETEKHFTVTLKDDKRIEGAETLSLAFATITGGAVSPSSSTCLVTVTDNDGLPSLGVNPASALLAVGDPLVLSIPVTSSSPATFIWKKNNVPLPPAVAGSRSPQLFLPSVAITDGGTYILSVTNATGKMDSNPIIIGVYERNVVPVDYNGPQATGRFTGMQKASSNCVLHWFKGSTEITTALPAGVTLTANRSQLTVTNLSVNSDNYTCQVELPGVTILPHPVGTSFNIFSNLLAPTITTQATLPAATVGRYYTAAVALSAGTADRWTAVGLPAGLTLSGGLISGFPESAITTPRTVTITAINGVGSSTIKPTITVSAIAPDLLGAHYALLPRHPDFNHLGGLLNLTVTPNGYCTGSFTLGAEKGSVVGRVLSSNGIDWQLRDPKTLMNATAIIAGRKVELAFSYTAAANPTGSGSLTFISGPFTVLNFGSIKVLTGATLANYVGKHTFALRLKDAPDRTNVSLPQAHGYGTATVALSGAVGYVGKTADATVFTASAPLLVGGYSPFYAPLYTAKGSVMALPQFTLSGLANADTTIFDMNSATWSKLPDSSLAGARNYPAGWSPINLKLEGSRYTAPATGAVVMGLSYTPWMSNAGFEADLDAFEDEPKLGPLFIGVKSRGAIAPPVPNLRSLALSIEPATGLFTGSINMTDILPNYVPVSRPGAKIEALVVRIIGQIPEQRAYGFLTLPAMPDYRISPTPPAAKTPILSVPVMISPYVP
jgi:hypothetical protein